MKKNERCFIWIASKYGFYSIKYEEGKNYHVRGRKYDDLKNLAQAAGIDTVIEEWNKTDYTFRILLNDEELSKIMSTLQASIDYPNFKQEISETENQTDKLEAYHNIWSEMFHYGYNNK